MADTLVETAVSPSSDSRLGLWGPYWSDESTGVIVFIDDASDLSFARTVDKGVSWSTTEIEAGTAMVVAAWYDKETPGDSGTLVHVAWLDSAGGVGARNAFYISIDVSDGSQGTKRTIDSGITVEGDPADNRIAITKTVSGNLIVAFSTFTELECYRASSPYSTWTDRADVFETLVEDDFVLLFPAATGDDDDACAMFWDASDQEITLKMYDETANSWTEFATPIQSPAYIDIVHINMDGSVRHSDSHVLVAWHTNDDSSTDVLDTADLTVDSISAPTVTSKTAIFTNQGESAQVSVFINQQNDDVYVAYCKGNPTWTSKVDVVYHKSVNGMGAWGSEQAYSESVEDDFRLVHAGRTVGDDGGRYQLSFYDDDQVDIYINETNDIEIAAVGVAGQPTQQRTQGIPTGSGFRDRPGKWN